MSKSTTTLTRELVLTHERLYPRLAALLKQVERVAARRPTQPVSEESLRLARELCREAARLLGPEGRGIELPRGAAAAGLDQQNLAVALGQALAGLEAFEAAHASFAQKHLAVSWFLADGTLLPVSRLKPQGPPKGPFPHAQNEAEKQHNKGFREKLEKRLIRRENFAYYRGYKDAQAGKPPRTPLTEFESVP